jgi:hypothetical protein
VADRRNPYHYDKGAERRPEDNQSNAAITLRVPLKPIRPVVFSTFDRSYSSDPQSRVGVVLGTFGILLRSTVVR